MKIDIPNVEIPEGKSGEWTVEKFTVSEQEAKFFNLRAMRTGRGILAGTYTRLCCGREVVMSDTPAEKCDHMTPVIHAKGKILINGLGLGMVATACLLKPEVERAVIIEKSPDVIALTAPSLLSKFGDRLQIVQADAYEFKPTKGSRFGMVWHDIWNEICGDNKPQMMRLHRKYAKRTEWQDSWCSFETYRLAS